MRVTEPLEYGHTYHIYNRGINGTDLFLCNRDYEHFLELYTQYISPIADTYAWALLKNHFHILVRIKDKEEIKSFTTDLSVCETDLSVCEAADSVETGNRKISTLTGLRRCQVGGSSSTLTGSNEHCQVVPVPSRQFSHLFNAYARYFNIRTERHGGLFETPFRRIRVNTERYFRQLVFYIHHNPVKHGFAEHILDWGWSSYLTIISVKPTRLSRETVLGYFDDAANFKTYHQQEHDLRYMESFFLEI